MYFSNIQSEIFNEAFVILSLPQNVKCYILKILKLDGFADCKNILLFML